MLFLFVSFVSAAQASSLFSFLLNGGSSTNNTVTGGNATNSTTDSLMKQIGIGSVTALSANAQFGIYAVQADNNLYYKKDMNAPVEQVNTPSIQGKITQLLDLKIALFALTDNNQVYFCPYPCNAANNWQSAMDTSKYKIQKLVQLGANLGMLTDNNMLLIKSPDVAAIQEKPSQGIKHAHALPGSDFQAYVDKDGKLVLVNRKNNNLKQNFLGEGYTAALLTETYLYGMHGQMVARCKLPCEGNDAKMDDYMAGKDVILMASYNKNILACNKGAPLVAVAEDN